MSAAPVCDLAKARIPQDSEWSPAYTPTPPMAPPQIHTRRYTQRYTEIHRDTHTEQDPADPPPAVPVGLPPPTAGLALKHVAIGRGVQNYTCDLANATAVPVSIGAVATLFNASCVAGTYPDLLNMLPRVALQFNLTASEARRTPRAQQPGHLGQPLLPEHPPRPSSTSTRPPSSSAPPPAPRTTPPPPRPTPQGPARRGRRPPGSSSSPASAPPATCRRSTASRPPAAAPPPPAPACPPPSRCSTQHSTCSIDLPHADEHRLTLSPCRILVLPRPAVLETAAAAAFLAGRPDAHRCVCVRVCAITLISVMPSIITGRCGAAQEDMHATGHLTSYLLFRSFSVALSFIPSFLSFPASPCWDTEKAGRRIT